jgi:hypothetical protein
MASFTYNEGALQLAQGGSVNWTTDNIEILILKSTYTPDKDHTAGTPAASELASLTGYVPGFGGAGRKLLGTKTGPVKNTTADQIQYTAADPSQWTIVAGDTIGGFLVQKKGSANDTTAVPLFWIDVTDFATNGVPFQFSFTGGIVGYIQQ